ncbi:hypothetical protein [Nannocystis pusilla]|uniref:hypothetical protein n=1 Tax=Nannocystis pusilla TaxID=889268 RepID=UPI003B7EEA70
MMAPTTFGAPRNPGSAGMLSKLPPDHPAGRSTGWVIVRGAPPGLATSRSTATKAVKRDSTW